MSRWLIWSQVVFATIGAVATQVDQGVVSRSFAPPEIAIIFSAWSSFLIPAWVLYLGRGREPGSGQTIEAIASIGLGVATFFAVLPLIQ